MRQAQAGGTTAWVHAVASPIIGLAAVLTLGVNWFDATLVGLVAMACALVGLIKEAQDGDVSPRRHLHVAGLGMGLVAAVVPRIAPQLLGFLLL
ncbi:hypothetical protein [Streptomyces apocyni]|uniref:hypothetical protein n=1 Tax=Streptomyces apocyni TaxID=2654677 RepID=UPI0012EA96FD|nr:hypothetical protein [Streptomyces apocyni]